MPLRKKKAQAKEPNSDQEDNAEPESYQSKHEEIQDGMYT